MSPWLCLISDGSYAPDPIDPPYEGCDPMGKTRFTIEVTWAPINIGHDFAARQPESTPALAPILADSTCI